MLPSAEACNVVSWRTQIEWKSKTYGVLGLAQLVANGILAGGGTGTNISVGVLGDVLVGLLGGSVGELAGLVTDVVGSVPVDMISFDDIKDRSTSSNSLDGVHCDRWDEGFG